MQKMGLFFICISWALGSFAQEAQVMPYERADYIEFVENKGQWDNSFQFMAEVPGGFLYLEENQIKFQFYNTAVFEKVNKKVLHAKYHFIENPLPWHGINLKFLNANPMSWSGVYKNKGAFNFIYGQNPEKWIGNVSAYGSIKADQLYKGIDLKMYVNSETVKYDFVVAPGVNPKIIKWKYEGGESVKLHNGKIRVRTSFNLMEELAPYAFQVINGVQTQVPCNFTEKNEVFGFEFPEGFHSGHRLIIDPELIFSTFSGSVSDNFGYTATYDEEGNLYSGSTAFENQYVTTIGAYDRVYAGGTDIAITKYSDDGRSRVYSTYIGGLNDEMPHSLIVNKKNELYVFGSSESTDYPTTAGAYDEGYNAGGSYTPSGLGVDYLNGSDIIISKLSSDGSQMLASTFVGGNNIDGLNTSSNKLVYNYADEVRGEIILDDSENVLIATSTRSSDIPIVGNGFQAVIGGRQDGYVAKLDRNLSNIIWSTYIGGGDDDAIYSLDTDKDNNVYVTGGTISSNFPVTASAYQTGVNMGRASGFVAKLNSTGSVLMASTYYGKDQEYVQAYFVESNKDQEIIVFGQVENANGSFLNNAGFGVANGGLFITKFNANLSDRVWSTSFGLNNGRPAISPTAFLVDVCNKIYVSGWGGGPNVSFANNNTTGTTGLPITSGAIQSTTDDNDFYLMVLEDDASAIVFGSFFGGATAREHVDGGTSRFDKRGIIYQSVCAGCGGLDDFPIFPADAVSPTNNSTNCNNGVFKIDFEFDLLIADFKFDPICLPDPVVFNNTTENGFTFEWDFGDGATSTLENPSHIYNNAGTYNVRLIASNINTCNSNDTIVKEVTVLDDKTYDLPSVQTCENDAVQIGISDFSQDLTYRWKPGLLVSDSTDANPFAFPTETTRFLLLISNGICTDSVYQNVVVIDPTLNVPPSQIFCEPIDSLLLKITKNDPNSVVFWANDPDFNDIIAVDKDTIYIDLPASTIVYVKSVNNGCEVNYQIPLIVEDVQIYLTPDEILCDSDEYSFKGLGVGGSSGSYLYEIPYFWDITQDTFDSINFVPDSSRWYVVTVRDVVSGCSDTDSIYVGLVDDQFDIRSNLMVCDADTIVLNATRNYDETISTGEWFPKNLIVNEPGFGQATVSPNGPTNYWFTSYGTDSNCTHIDTILVTISEPKISLPDTFEVCSGDTVTVQVINVSSDGSVLTYKWEENEAIIDADSLSEIHVVPKETTYLVIQATNQLGCVLYDSVLFRFPDLGLTLTPDTFICAGDTINIRAFSSGRDNLIYEWSPEDDIINGNNADSIITVSPTTSKFYSLNVTSTGNCKSSYGVQVVVSSDFVKPAFGKTICEGDTARLSINIKFPSYNPSIEWQPAEKIIGSNSRLFIFTAPTETTDYTYKVTVDDKCPIIDTLRVTYSKIYVVVPDFVRFCTNETATISAMNLDSSQAITYDWITASVIISGEGTRELTIKPNQDTVVTLLVTNQFGCEKEFKIPVFLSEPDFELTNDTLLCIGEEIYLKASNANPLDNFNFNWLGSAVMPPSDNDSVLINPQVSEYIYVTGTNQIGCVKQDSVQIVVAPDQLVLSPDSSICNGDSIWISASAKYSEFPVYYMWSGPRIIREKGDSVLVMPDSSATYQVSIITSDSCTYSDEYKLEVIVIDVNLTPDTLICDGNSVELEVLNNNTNDTLNFKWIPNNGTINANKYSVTPDTSTYYVVESTNIIGCKRTDTVLVALVSEYTFITNQDSICYGDTIVFFANNRFQQFQADYTWIVSDTNTKVLNALNQDLLIIVPDTSMYVELLTTSGLGCDPIDSSRVFVSKIYISLPDSLILCTGDTAVVHLTNLDTTQNLSYNWTFNGLIIGDYTSDSVMFVPLQDSYLGLLTTNELGCSRYDEVTFSVTSIDYTMTGNILLCPGDQGVLEVENNNANHILTYYWTPAYGMISNNDLNQITVQPDSTTRYFVSMTNQHGCTTLDSADAVLTNDMIEVTPDTVVCAGDVVTLKATNLYPEFVVSYDWIPSSEIIGATDESSIQISLFLDQTYQVVINNELGCSYSESIDVTVSRVSLASFTAYTDEDSIAFGGTTNIWVEPYNSNYNYHWEPSEVALYPDSFETSVTLNRTTRMTGTVTDGYCLKDFDVLIYVSDLICDEPNIFIPNAFTPNNDGENDVLFLRGNNLVEIDLKVYDRWGELVFETNDQSRGWDGFYKGVALDPAVFVFHLKAQCENNLSYFKKGNVTLIR
jgi:gliding motility-associated-like protein